MNEDIEKAVGRRIASIVLDGETDRLNVAFDGGDVLRIWDDGQTCCERRYMSTDDDLAHYAGATFIGADVRHGDNREDDEDVHEVAFLIVNTSLGSFTVANHNEHNGYYGGFDIDAKLIPFVDEQAAEAAREVARLAREAERQENARIKEMARHYAELAAEDDAKAKEKIRRIVELRHMPDAEVARLVTTMDREEGVSDVLEVLSQAGFVRVPKEEISATIDFVGGGSCRLRGMPDAIQRLQRELSNRARITQWVAA